VTLPPGRARLATSPAATGSIPTWKRIGIVAGAAQFCGLVALAGADYLKRRPTLGTPTTPVAFKMMPLSFIAAARTLGAYVHCSLREFEKCLEELGHWLSSLFSPVRSALRLKSR
jgi:hypothetical protein